MLIYDCEIQKAILGNGESPRPGISYCQGWKDHVGMGISVICAYDYWEGRYRVFCQDNFAEFQALLERRPLVGFNNIGFDNKLLRANGFKVNDSDCYDLLQQIWIAAGLAPEYKTYATHGGFSLDLVCHANFKKNKTGDGALAPVMWQQGRAGSVIDYCLEDVRLTKMLLDRVIERGMLIHPKEPLKVLNVRRPQ